MSEVNRDIMGVYLACVLQALKDRYRLSQRDVAAILELPPQLVSDLKYARKPMTPALMQHIADTFGFSWVDIARAVPNRWREQDEIIHLNENNPALNGIDRSIDRYAQALLLEVPKLDSQIFPALKEPQIPARTGGRLKLPIRDHPAVGNPSMPPGYSGYSSVLPEPATEVARHAKQPYLLRFLGTDHQQRFFAGDLLLVDQRIPEKESAEGARSVVVIRSGAKYLLARRSEWGYEPVSLVGEESQIMEGRAEVVGIVKAVVWSEVR